MPILIKGSGGVQKTPTISVNANGTITATAGKKSATTKLSASHDSDFVPLSIAKGKTIFGVTGAANVADETVYATTLAGSGSNYMSIPTSESVSGKTLMYCAIMGDETTDNTGYDTFEELIYDYRNPHDFSDDDGNEGASYTYYDESSSKHRRYIDAVSVSATSSGFKITVLNEGDVVFFSECDYSCIVVYK